MNSSRDVLSLIEAAYRPRESALAWLQEVTEAFVDVMGEGLGGAGIFYDAGQSGDIRVKGMHTCDLPSGLVEEILRQPACWCEQALFSLCAQRTPAFATARRTLRPLFPRMGDALARLGLEDAAFVNVIGPAHRGAIIGVVNRGRPYAPRTRHLWRQVSAHLSVGLRLQEQLSALTSAEQASAQAASPLSGCRERTSHRKHADLQRELLCQALARLESTPPARYTQALVTSDVWSALCSGRWSLIEDFERDGRCYFLVCRNEPRLAKARALSERERRVCEYAALGYSNKLIAYSLGLAVSTVAAHLERARRKLGGKARLEALQGLLPGFALRAPHSAPVRAPAVAVLDSEVA
ncbi:MAG: helix-turn-helix transcriptional regulator [Myxococcota bacterium]